MPKAACGSGGGALLPQPVTLKKANTVRTVFCPVKHPFDRTLNPIVLEKEQDLPEPNLPAVRRECRRDRVEVLHFFAGGEE